MSKVLENVKYMLKNRGYVFESLSDLDNISIFYIKDEKVGIKTLKTIEETCKPKGILIYDKGITTFAKQYLPKMSQDIETFHSNELKFDLNQHSFIPEVTIISEGDKQDLLNTFSAVEKELFVFFYLIHFKIL